MRGDVEQGFAAYEAAIRWSAPFHRYGVVAREELFAVIRSPERTSEERRQGLELLVSALETSRHGLSGLDSRRDEILVDARTKLTELRGPDVYVVRPSTPPRVRYSFQVIAQILFWAWMALTAWLIWRGFDTQARPQWPVLKRGALPIVVVYLLWLVALRFA